MFCRPCVSWAALLLPASRAALATTARWMGVPFQCVTSTPAFSCGSPVMWSNVLVTTYAVRPLSTQRSRKTPRKAKPAKRDGRM